MKKSHSIKADTASRQATYQDVLDAPQHMVAEIVGGKLYTHPRPAFRHAIANSGLGILVGWPFHFGRGGPGGWWIIDEPELHLGEDIVVPDIAGWRRQRMPEIANYWAYFARWLRTGCARCFPRQRESLILAASGRCTPGRESAIFG